MRLKLELTVTITIPIMKSKWNKLDNRYNLLC